MAAILFSFGPEMNATNPKRISLAILPQLMKEESEKKEKKKKKKKKKKILPKPIGHPISSDLLINIKQRLKFANLAGT